MKASPAKPRRAKAGGPSAFEALAKYFDRADPLVRARQDVAAHALLFAAACYVLHHWGHKLAV